MLADPAVRPLIEETYNALNGAIDTAIKTETPPELTAALQNNAFIFSGFKTYHSLSEVGLALTDADGNVKPFETFRKDVEAIDSKYNTNYLFAEYNHALSTSQMAVKWHDIMQDGDRYNLQYLTAGDERVRSEHATLDNTTLPPSDEFWKFYLPPNGWNCRCTVEQVLRDDYPMSDPAVAKAAGDACTEEPKARMFRYNAGQEMTIFPKKHPYLPKGCGNCGGSLNLAYDPKREQCRVCRVVSEQARKAEVKRLYDRLSRDDKYTGVRYDPVTGGLSATHIGHNSKSTNQELVGWGMTGAQLEAELQNLLFKNGHITVLCDEQKKKDGKTLRALDMQLDGVMMDIRSITKKKRHYGSAILAKNSQLLGYNERTDVTIPADTVCLYFHDASMYHPGKIRDGIKYTKQKAKHGVAVKNVVCILRKDDDTIEIRRHTA
ncbi:MAG: hypothetical protein HDS24_03380 [Bacteroides sp.]|nr:hypothetical protein [Bacteroides sp.]